MTLKILAGDWEVQGVITLDKLLTLKHPTNSDIFARVTPLTAIVNGNALTGTNKHFNWSGGEYPNATIARKNFVVEFGHNTNQGTLVDSTDDGFRDAWESCWEAGPGVYLFERHISFIPRATPSQEVRAMTITFNRTTLYTSGGHNVDEWVLWDRATGRDLWHWTNGGRILNVGGTFGGVPETPVIIFSVNNYRPMKQLNALANAYCYLPYIDGSDQTVLGDSNGKVVVSNLGTQGILKILGAAGADKKAVLSLLSNGFGEAIISMDGTKLYFGASAGGNPANYNDATLKAYASMSLSNAGVVTLPSGGAIRYVSTTNVDTGTVDLGTARNAAGVLEVNNGTGGTYRDVKVRDVITTSTTLHRTTTALTNGAAAAAGTLTNAPVAGNPTKWVAIDDNGVTRYIPAW